LRKERLKLRAQDEASYRKNFPALNEVLKSFAYMKVEGDHKQH
jgi:hypothetical protein